MIVEGDIILFRFPQTDFAEGKLRPALLLRKIPNEYGDWFICMVSTQLHQQIEELEVIVGPSDPDFVDSGLKRSSLIRSSRIAVVNENIFEGKLGSISTGRLREVRERFANWIRS